MLARETGACVSPCTCPYAGSNTETRLSYDLIKKRRDNNLAALVFHRFRDEDAEPENYCRLSWAVLYSSISQAPAFQPAQHPHSFTAIRGTGERQRGWVWGC